MSSRLLASKGQLTKREKEKKEETIVRSAAAMKPLLFRKYEGVPRPTTSPLRDTVQFLLAREKKEGGQKKKKATIRKFHKNLV